MEPNSRRRRACCRTAPPALSRLRLCLFYPSGTQALSRCPLPPAGPARFEQLRGRGSAGLERQQQRTRGRMKRALSRLRPRVLCCACWVQVSPMEHVPPLGVCWAPPRVIPSTASSLRMLVITAAPGSGEGDFSALTLVHEDHLGLWSPRWKRRSWAATRVENTCRCGDVQRGVPGGEEGEARPGRLLAGMVTHEGTVTHSRAHSASAFASTGRRASRSTPPPAAQDIKTGCPCGMLHRSSRGRSRGAIAAFKAGGAVGIGLLVSCRTETSHHGQQPLWRTTCGSMSWRNMPQDTKRNLGAFPARQRRRCCS